MTLPDITRYLICNSCGKVEKCGTLRILERLREQQMWLDGAEPERALILSQLDQAAESLGCGSCGKSGVAIELEDPMDDVDWGNEKKPARKCEACSAEIPAERIEIFPNTTMCTKCQSGEELGESRADEEFEYCPRCGNIMQLKQGPRGYRMSCPSCRR